MEAQLEALKEEVKKLQEHNATLTVLPTPGCSPPLSSLRLCGRESL